MAFAEFNEFGFNRKSLTEIRAIIEADYRSIWGQNVVLDNSEPDGQEIGIIAYYEDQNMQLLEAVWNSFSPNRASGISLQDVVNYNGITILDESKSTVTLTINTNQANVAYPSGLIFSDINNQTNWVANSGFTTDSSGNATVTATAEKYGKYQALANTITQIKTPQYGLLSVSNPEPAQLGRYRETNAELRSRNAKSKAFVSDGNGPSVEAGVKQVDGVQDVAVLENKTNAYIFLESSKYRLKPHSFCVVVLGGDDQVIADTIRKRISGGCDTGLDYDSGGGTYVDYTDNVTLNSYTPKGNAVEITFTRPTLIGVHLQIEFPTNISIDYDLSTKITEAFKTYIESETATGDEISALAAIMYVFNQLGITLFVKDAKIETTTDSGLVDSLKLGLLENAQGSLSTVTFIYS